MREDGLAGTSKQDIARMTAEQIMRETGVQKTKAYAILRDARGDALAEGANESLKGRVLAAIEAVGSFNDVMTLRFYLATDESAYEISRALWGLKKQGDIQFHERKQGSDSLITNIKIARGFHHKRINPEIKRRHPVGVDMTDPYNHGARTTGGEITRTRPAAPEIIPAPGYSAPAEPVPPRYSAPEPVPQNMKPFTDEESLSPIEAEAHVQGMEAHGNGLAPDTHTQYPDLATAADALVNNYPLIAALLTKALKEEKLLAAAELLIEADEEMANELLGRLSITDLEKEIIAYVQVHG